MTWVDAASAVFVLWGVVVLVIVVWGDLPPEPLDRRRK